jgi:hypothetical protein
MSVLLKKNPREGTREGLRNKPRIYTVNSVAKEEYNLQTTVYGKLILNSCFLMQLVIHFWITDHHDYSSHTHQRCVCTNKMSV